MNKISRIKELTKELNRYRKAYYIDQESLISDYEYDNLFDELKQLEDETGFVMTNSPTSTVGYEVVSELPKVKHSHPMLSLSKTKSVKELCKFLGNKAGVMMLKLDGLTVSLCYKNGILYSAETRGNGEILVCANPECSGKLLGRLVHFCSKNAMDIKGLSEETLQKFIEKGWLKSFKDIYSLMDLHRKDIEKMSGFGRRSAEKLDAAIEQSKQTTLEKFIYSLSIPLIGRSASKTISKYFRNDFKSFYENGLLDLKFDWTKLDDFGDGMDKSIRHFARYSNMNDILYLANLFEFDKGNINNGNELSGLTFVITGSLNKYTNREELKTVIESAGGKVTNSVTKKTSFLINNDVTSSTGKNKKAKELGIAIIDENKFAELLRGDNI